MDKGNVVCMHNSFLFLNDKEEQGYVICRKCITLVFHVDAENCI